jgi:hypothetical protein
VPGFQLKEPAPGDPIGALAAIDLTVRPFISSILTVVADPTVEDQPMRCDARTDQISPPLGLLTVILAPVGVAAAAGLDSALLPYALVAWTVKLYPVPLVSPATVADMTPAPTDAVAPPGEAVTV